VRTNVSRLLTESMHVSHFRHQRTINMRACATPTTTAQSQLFYNKHGMLTNVHVIFFAFFFSFLGHVTVD